MRYLFNILGISRNTFAACFVPKELLIVSVALLIICRTFTSSILLAKPTCNARWYRTIAPSKFPWRYSAFPFTTKALKYWKIMVSNEERLYSTFDLFSKLTVSTTLILDENNRQFPFVEITTRKHFPCPLELVQNVEVRPSKRLFELGYLDL